MFYIVIGALITSFCSGFGVAWHNDKQTIALLNQSILSQKKEAESIQDKLAKQLAIKETQALDLNTELNLSHESAINSINSLRDSIKPMRLRDPGKRRQSSDCSMSKTSNTGITKEQASGTELSEELTRFLQSESYRADELAAYANTCYKFVSAQCGVK
jgi:hypothetical protein